MSYLLRHFETEDPKNATSSGGHCSSCARNLGHKRSPQSLATVHTQLPKSTDMRDIKKFISEIKARPEIWDTSLVLDRATRNQAWNELCFKCIPKFDKKSVREKSILVNELKKKWKGLRDSFRKEYCRQIRQQQNDSDPSCTRKPYTYYQNLTFLIKVTEPPVTESPGPQEEDSIEPSAPDNHTTEKREAFKMETPEPQQETISLQSFPPRLSECEMDEADRNFMFSLLPHLRHVPQEYKLDAQMEILMVLKRFKSQQHFEYFSQPEQHSVIQESKPSPSVSYHEQVASVDSSIKENRY